MRGGLEVALEIHDERMINNGEYFLLTLHVIDLFQFYDGTFLQAFESQWISIIAITAVLDQSDSTEGTCSQGRQDMEVIKEKLASFLSLGSILDLFLRLVIMNLWVIDSVLLLFLYLHTFGRLLHDLALEFSFLLSKGKLLPLF